MKSRNQNCYSVLTTDQLDDLTAIVIEEQGSALNREEFCEAILMLFEDIAGLEMLTQAKQKKLLTELWSRYRRSNNDLQRH